MDCKLVTKEGQEFIIEEEAAWGFYLQLKDIFKEEEEMNEEINKLILHGKYIFCSEPAICTVKGIKGNQ